MSSAERFGSGAVERRDVSEASGLPRRRYSDARDRGADVDGAVAYSRSCHGLSSTGEGESEGMLTREWRCESQWFCSRVAGSETWLRTVDAAILSGGEAAPRVDCELATASAG
jgi:hypothetical protein